MPLTLVYNNGNNNSSGNSSSSSSSNSRGGRSRGGNVTGTADTGAAAAQAALLEAERQRQEAEAQRKADEAAQKAKEAEEEETVVIFVTQTTENSTMAAIAEIVTGEDDEPEEGSYAGGNLGGIAGLGTDGAGATMDEYLDANTGDVDIEEAEEIAQNSPEIQRVVEITRIVNDEQLTDAERASLLDCYSKTYHTSITQGGQGTSPSEENAKQKSAEDAKKTAPSADEDGTAEIEEYEVRKYVDNNDIEAYGNTLSSGYAEFDVAYNYASYEFEDYVLAKEPMEASLPSFSNFINLGPKSTSLNAVSTACLSYDNILPRAPRTYFGNLSSRAEKSQLAGGSVSIYYQDLFSSLQYGDDMLGDIAQANKNYFFHQSFIKAQSDKNFLKKHFPVYVNIELSSFRAKNTKRKVEKTLASVLLKNEMETRFLTYLAERTSEEGEIVGQDQEGSPVRLWGVPLAPASFLGKNTYNNKNSISFWSEGVSRAEMPSEVLNLTLEEFLETRAGLDESLVEQEIQYFKEQKALSEKLSKMSSSEVSSYREGSYLADLSTITRTREQHKETIVFKVSKYEEGSDEPIQNFFFLNDSEGAPISFVDTQVNIAKTYNYKVFAYEILLPSTGTHSLVLETEVFRQDGIYIVSKPPMPPDVTIAPYMGNENDVLFLMNDSSGKALMEPTFFDETERDRILKISGIYGRRIPDPTISAEDFRIKSDEEKFKNLLEYEYDGRSVLFEVYRTSTPPKSYKDFAGSRITRTTGTSYKDGIAPNTKYYYTFRCMDNHGNISNPSAVYEVEIVKSFNVFPNIRVYEFPNEIKETRETKRNMKRFLRITPETKFLPLKKKDESLTLNSAYDATKTSYEPGLDTGIESLWGKKFKLRLTSKSSGKKIDFNFSFTKSFIGNT